MYTDKSGVNCICTLITVIEVPSIKQETLERQRLFQKAEKNIAGEKEKQKRSITGVGGCREKRCCISEAFKCCHMSP